MANRSAVADNCADRSGGGRYHLGLPGQAAAGAIQHLLGTGCARCATRRYRMLQCLGTCYSGIHVAVPLLVYGIQGHLLSPNLDLLNAWQYWLGMIAIQSDTDHP